MKIAGQRETSGSLRPRQNSNAAAPVYALIMPDDNRTRRSRKAVRARDTAGEEPECCAGERGTNCGLRSSNRRAPVQVTANEVNTWHWPDRWRSDRRPNPTARTVLPMRRAKSARNPPRNRGDGGVLRSGKLQQQSENCFDIDGEEKQRIDVEIHRHPTNNSAATEYLELRAIIAIIKSRKQSVNSDSCRGVAGSAWF